MFVSAITWLLNAIHFVFIFIPIALLLIPKKVLGKQSLLLKIVALLIFLTPLHWKFIENKCVLSLVSIKLGNEDYRTNTDSPFTRENMGPFYKPFMWLFGLKWESEEDLDLMVNSHWVLNFVITWYVLAFKLCKN